MTSAAIGNITLAIIFLAVVMMVIGALASVNWIWRKDMALGLVGKAYRNTFILIFAGLTVIGIAVWVL